MDELIGLEADPIEVRTRLLKVIGSREEGISRYELSKKMCTATKGRELLFYDEILSSMIMERLVVLSYCGLDNHRVSVYKLYGPQECVDPIHEQVKVCRSCQVSKSLTMFRKRYDSKDRHCGQCRACENKRRKADKWRSKAANKRSEEERKRFLNEIAKQDQEESLLGPSKGIPSHQELDASIKEVRAESLETYRRKHGGARYVMVDGRAIPVLGRELSPVEEYDRAWRRIKMAPRNQGTLSGGASVNPFDLA